MATMILCVYLCGGGVVVCVCRIRMSQLCDVTLTDGHLPTFHRAGPVNLQKFPPFLAKEDLQYDHKEKICLLIDVTGLPSTPPR